MRMRAPGKYSSPVHRKRRARRQPCKSCGPACPAVRPHASTLRDTKYGLSPGRNAVADARDLFKNLRVPVIGSPMFLVSGPELVIEQCKAGIIGSFPALNARPQEELDVWLTRIETA